MLRHFPTTHLNDLATDASNAYADPLSAKESSPWFDNAQSVGHDIFCPPSVQIFANDMDAEVITLDTGLSPTSIDIGALTIAARMRLASLVNSTSQRALFDHTR